MDLENFRIGILSIGKIPEFTQKVVAAHFLATLYLPIDILPALKHPDYAFDTRRVQYNAATIIDALEENSSRYPFCDYHKVIAIVDIDLFIPIFAHVFGEARQGGKFALISLYRLNQTPEQAAKLALHEFGHLCDLIHCSDHNCLMHFAYTVGELDLLPMYFCQYCLQKLKKEITGN